MDKKIVTAIFIVLCIVVPMLWFSINYAIITAQGNNNATIGQQRLVALVQTILQNQNYQYQKYQLDMFIKQEPEIIGFAVYKLEESPLVIFPGNASLEQLNRMIKPLTTIAFAAELSSGYKLMSIAALISPERMRTLGFQTIGLFLFLFFLLIFFIAVFPVKNKKYTGNSYAANLKHNAHEELLSLKTAKADENTLDESSQQFQETQHQTQLQSQTQQPQQIRTTLFDPHTGLCWAEDLIPRLDEEIKRAASFENELVFIIACLDMNLYESEDYKVFCDTVQKFFSFRDMIFQYRSDCIGIILQNMDIDHALRMCDELIKKITYLIQQNKNEMHYVEAFFGMSARGGRILDSKRLIHEAETALAKAIEEHDTHIVAFKPDLEKYKQYIMTTGQ